MSNKVNGIARDLGVNDQTLRNWINVCSLILCTVKSYPSFIKVLFL